MNKPTKQLMHRMCQLCDYSYLTPREFKKTITDYNHYAFLHGIKTDTQVHCLVYDDYNYVIPKGTDEVEDVFVDSSFVPADTSYGKIHSGFFQSALDVWYDLLMFLEKTDSLNKPTIFTGHSLGGAVAQVLAAIAYYEEFLNCELIMTFGAPRVAMSDFEERYEIEPINERTYRVVRFMDVVTGLPPLILGFRHVGNFIYINNDDEIQYEENGLWSHVLDDMQDSVTQLFRSSDKGERQSLLQAHSISNYLHDVS